MTRTIVALLLKIASRLEGEFYLPMTPGGEAEIQIEGFFQNKT